MSTGCGAGDRKRRHYNDENGGNVLFMSEAGRKKFKSEAPDNTTSDELGDGRRGSLQDPDDSANEGEENVNESDDDDDSNDDEGYSEEQELFPSHPAFDKKVTDVKELLARLAKNALASVNGSTCTTDQVNELRRMAEGISVIPEHTRETIGLVGDAGLGKSSLVNSLCDCPELAKALDAGKSCTYVITKYQRAGPEQKLKYSFKVAFYDLATIANVLSKALDDWHTFYYESDSAWTPEEAEVYESKAATCLCTFRAVFSNFPEFRTDDMATNSLHNFSQSSMSKEDTIQDLAGQAQTILKQWQQADGSYIHYHEAETTDDLWEELDLFITAGPDPDQPAPWPLVKDVCVGVKGSRILDHYVLVDMPGISDTNELRVDATQQFLMECDHLIVVARAGRVTTDTVVRSILQKYGTSHNGNVMVVCTKSDENVDHKVAIEMERLGFDIGNYRELKESIKSLASETKALERKKKKTAQAGSKLSDVQEKLDDAKAKKRLSENAMWELVVAARNVHNADRLRKDRQHHLPAGKTLHVFGVSNKHYATLLVGEACEEYQLSPEGTGIPGLRRHLLELAAPRVWDSLTGFVNSELTALIPSFKMWAGTGHLASGRAAIAEVLKQQRQQVRLEFAEYQSSMVDLVRQHFENSLRNERAACVGSATNYVNQTLASWAWKTFEAFFKRNGQHTTPLKSESWNEIFTAKSTEIIERSWPSFTSDWEVIVQSMQDKIIEAVQEIPKNLRAGMREASVASMATFEEGLKGHISGIRQIFRRNDQIFVKILRAIYIDATVDGRSNYFAAGMQGAYDACRNSSGKGVQKRTLAIMVKHLNLTGAHSPFAILAEEFRSNIETATDAQAYSTPVELDVIFTAIHRDVKAMGLKRSEHPSEMRIRRTVAKFVAGAGPMLEKAKEILQTIESRYEV